MMNFIRKHPIFVIGFFAWLFAILSILLIPKYILNKGKCEGCDEYSNFIKSASTEQKEKLEMLEMGAINVGGEFFLVGVSSKEEYDLYDKQLIQYKPIDPVFDEKTERMIILNSIIKYLPSAERGLILDRKAVIIYRNGDYILVYDKNAFEAINKFSAKGETNEEKSFFGSRCCAVNYWCFSFGITTICSRSKL